MRRGTFLLLLAVAGGPGGTVGAQTVAAPITTLSSGVAAVRWQSNQLEHGQITAIQREPLDAEIEHTRLKFTERIHGFAPA